MDPNTFFSGNPGLLPAITDNVNLSYTYRKKILTLGYSYTKDPITNFSPRVDPATNKETLAAENQDNRKTLYVGFSIPVDITEWWTLHANFNANYQRLRAFYMEEAVTLENKSFSFNATQNFRLPKEFTISVSGFYTSSALWGIYRMNAFGTLDLGIQKKMKDKKSGFRLNFGNILNSFKLNPEVNAPEKNLVARADLQFENPDFRLTFSRSFGNDKVKEKRNRSLRTEEEKDRLKQ
jgi:hypothetical protein